LENFNHIYSENYPKLFRLAIKITGDDNTAADIVQEIFINLTSVRCKKLNIY